MSAEYFASRSSIICMNTKYYSDQIKGDEMGISDYVLRPKSAGVLGPKSWSD
jgi:hypothetical protein